MNIKTFIKRNVSYYSRYYKLIATASLITVMVIVGSLVVGDSVQNTLVKRVVERLGDTETVIFSRNSFMNENLLQKPLFEETAKGFLLTDGFISQSGKLIPVFVWGTDELSIPKGSARINQALYKEINQKDISDIVLRLPASGLVPSGSLFVTENYTTGMRLAYDGVVEISEGGNLSMKNEQIIPLNIFVNRDELGEVLETAKKINLLLVNKEITEEDFNKAWDYTTSGLSVNSQDSFREITSDRLFLQKEITETVIRNNDNSNRLFSYLANSIELGENSVPYSFVTALDRFQNETLEKGDIILSDYTADRLHAKTGDRIHISYFISDDLKTLSTKTAELRVKKIVSQSELFADKTLSAHFPGLSNMDRCTDWDSDLPIDMNLITDEDERYWELYRSTPKAIIAYDAIADDWSNAFGNATAIRLAETEVDLAGLQPEMFGIQVIHPLQTGLYAARNGVDFAELFLALGFFIILSAMLLMLIPLSEMIWQRRQETTLLKALGFTRKKIAGILWKESVPVVTIASVVGVIVGLFYTTLIMWLLGNVWKGATHTDSFKVYPHITTIFIGLLVGVAISLILLRWVIIRNLKEKKVLFSQKKPSLRSIKMWAIFMSIISLALIVINISLIQSVALFVIIGIVLIGMAALWGNYIVNRNNAVSLQNFRTDKIVWSSLFTNKKQEILSFFALAMGVFIVFSVGLNRKGFADSSQLRTGTGGYSLWSESTVPVYHNMNTREGREKLSLTGLPQDAEILQCLRYSADDASCLNLNKTSTPTVLGVSMDALKSRDFQIAKGLTSSDRITVFEQMKEKDGNVYPALVDATVLKWGLGKSIGDTLHYKGSRGQDITIRLVGALANSIFQGHILVDRNNFSEIWEETSGSEIFLLKVNESEKDEVKTLLSNALNEYGVRVSSTNDRLKQFNSVTDTYLTIFLTLGGLGLLLGIMSFIIVVRKNLAMRYSETVLYRSLGFTNHKIEQILNKENLMVPLYAIVTGVICSIIGAGAGLMNVGMWIWVLVLLFTILFATSVIFFVRKSVRKTVNTIVS